MKPLYLDVPSLTLEKQKWLNDMAAWHRQEADASMTALTVGIVILGTLLTAIGMLLWG